jgi:hypothetical protein
MIIPRTNEPSTKDESGKRESQNGIIKTAVWRKGTAILHHDIIDTEVIPKKRKAKYPETR